MHVISRRALRDFGDNHPAARVPLAAWYRAMRRGDFADFSSVRKTFGTVDRVAPYTVFDVGGNKFRLIVAIHYNCKRVYVRHVFTHAEYDQWSDRLRKGKAKG